MKSFNNYSLISSLCSLAVGILLVVMPGVAAVYLVITIGMLFMIPGLVGVATYLMALRRGETSSHSLFPLVAVGSILFGLWLIIMPNFFIEVIMYILGVLLVLAGLNQLAAFVSARTYTTVPLGWYIIPVLVFIAGLVILFNPFDAAELPFIVLGSAFIVYSLTDLIRLFKYRKRTEDIQEAEEVKDEKEEKKIEENKEAK